MSFKFLVVDKIDKVKIIKENFCDVCPIDINMWFKANGLTPDSMNEIRQYIFEEWLSKKIASSKNKVIAGSQPVIIYEYTTSSFVTMLSEKITEVLHPEKCDVILFAE